MRVDLFDFALPDDLIAQRPVSPRDSARLLDVTGETLHDRTVRSLPGLLRRGDLLVFNDTRVIPARLRGMRPGQGIRQDVAQRPELASFADKIALWRDRYTPPPGEEDPLLAAYPYLGPDYCLLERVPGEAPWLADIHVFGIGATLSFGPSGSSINAMTAAVPKVAAGVTRGLFAGDLRRHWESLLAYDVKQVELDPTRLTRA